MMSKEQTKSISALSVVTAVATLTYDLCCVNLTGEATGTLYFFACIMGVAIIWLTAKCNYKEAWASIIMFVVGALLCLALLDESQTFRFVATAFVAEIIPVIIAIYKTTKRTVEIAGEAITWVVQQFIDLFTLKKEVKRKCPTALKMKIMEKKKNAVDVGIYNSASAWTPEQIVTIESTEGISSDIQVGEVYMLND